MGGMGGGTPHRSGDQISRGWCVTRPKPGPLREKGRGGTKNRLGREDKRVGRVRGEREGQRRGHLQFRKKETGWAHATKGTGKNTARCTASPKRTKDDH